MANTFCDEDDVKLKAGLNATTLTTAQYDDFINEAENFINVQAKIPNYNLIDNYASLSADVKYILRAGASALAANHVILYDQSGFYQGEISNLINYNWSIYLECVKLIKEKQYTTWMQEQT